MAIPGSFALPDKGFRGYFLQFQYFSFITITTLGYGDIIPLTDKASTLAICEAVVGQIYMVVLVAWLVGMHVSRKSQ
jgi:voltage-gated potassium channel